MPEGRDATLDMPISSRVAQIREALGIKSEESEAISAAQAEVSGQKDPKTTPQMTWGQWTNWTQWGKMSF